MHTFIFIYVITFYAQSFFFTTYKRSNLDKTASIVDTLRPCSFLLPRIGVSRQLLHYFRMSERRTDKARIARPGLVRLGARWK